jgi:hypothetical protein
MPYSLRKKIMQMKSICQAYDVAGEPGEVQIN